MDVRHHFRRLFDYLLGPCMHPHAEIKRWLAGYDKVPTERIYCDQCGHFSITTYPNAKPDDFIITSYEEAS